MTKATTNHRIDTTFIAGDIWKTRGGSLVEITDGPTQGQKEWQGVHHYPVMGRFIVGDAPQQPSTHCWSYLGAFTAASNQSISPFDLVELFTRPPSNMPTELIELCLELLQ